MALDLGPIASTVTDYFFARAEFTCDPLRSRRPSERIS
jgi:hypothetical protein